MSIPGISEERRQEMVSSALEQMRGFGEDLRRKIASQPPRELLGYIYAQRLTRDMALSDDDPGDIIGKMQFLLEYVHAAWASSPGPDITEFNEAVASELFEIAAKLRETAMMYAMMSAANTEDGVFGPNTADVEFRAKSNWVVIRGSRYQVLEGEFYRFVLAPHDEMLLQVYGVGSEAIGTGFQDLASAVFSGSFDAIEEMAKQFDAAQAFATELGRPLEEVQAEWHETHADETERMRLAFNDMIRGGICNVSQHTSLPAALLNDLAYGRGEEAEFYDGGQYSGTPFRTLPARKKPLIKLGHDYYAVDPCFTRDAGYRALLFNLLQRRPEYKKAFEAGQKAMSEAAFFKILAPQLLGAEIYQEVYYRDPATNQWVENDTLVLIDDMLILVEAKAGAAATIASPELDFQRHAQSVQDLVIKAYKQCARFFDYLATADEVSIFKRENDRYVECGRVCRSNYRLMIPIGLTVESFAPFSAMCKELPEIKPIHGKYPFLSISIDDLFVLKRIFSTTGELSHYLMVRQIVAGMKGVNLFDEMDHAGAYLKKNRFDMDIEEQRAGRDYTMVLWDGMSTQIDEYFGSPDWEAKTPPRQDFPSEVAKLLDALDATRARGWLAVSAAIRDYGDEGRENIAKYLETLRQSLSQNPHRYFLLTGKPPLFLWLQRAGTLPPFEIMCNKARSAAIADGSSSVLAMITFIDSAGEYVYASRFEVDVPQERNGGNAAVFDDAERMKARTIRAS